MRINYTYNTAAIAALNRNRAKALRELVITAEHESARQALVAAIRFSSGATTTIALQRLARMRGAGVYSRRSPLVTFAPEIINAQTGHFRTAWRVSSLFSADGVTLRLHNDSPEAKYMAGTGNMIPRPIFQKVIMQIRGSRFNRLSAALRRALKG